jgi:2-dehydropantoate 2-reductase
VADVYGICVMLPATMLEPGVVQAHGTPTNAILDVGRYPSGTDATATAVAAALVASGLVSEATPDIMRSKYRKLLMNLANPLDALVLEGEDTGAIHRRARHEAEACFAAAGIDYASAEEDRARREGVMRVTSLEGRPRGGGSTWQSLVRGSGTTEVDWLNGEIVLLGRAHGVPTPVNAMLQAVTRHAAQRGTPARSLKVADLEALIDE